MPLRKVNGFLIAFHNLHQGIGDVLFANRLGLLLDALGLTAHLEDQGSIPIRFAAQRILKITVLRDRVLLRNLRLFVGIDKFVGNFAVPAFVEIE